LAASKPEALIESRGIKALALVISFQIIPTSKII
jgi:hypothetical protein